MRMRNRRFLAIPFFFLIVFAIIAVLVLNGTIKLAVFGTKEIKKMASSTSELSNGNYYVWHSNTSIEEDLKNGSSSYVFKLCPSGTVNFKKNSLVNHTVWFTSENDVDIPTLYPGDKLLFVSDDDVPYEGISWERYADYGYSIGISNLITDSGGHCYIENLQNKGFKEYVFKNSDANQLNRDFSTYSVLFLDKVGGNDVRADSITNGGTVRALVKGKEYLCEFYTGTYYQDYRFTADVHTFGILEEFTTYDYKFLHSNCIEINIPSWFKTGYYYIENKGMFRYVSSLDKNIYNGEAYDESVNWNDPIKQYDDNGYLIYDPSTNFDRRQESTIQQTTKSTTSTTKSTYKKSSSSTLKSNADTSNGDVGVSAYEKIQNEVKVK